MFLATPELIPATYWSNDGVAVLISTPTSLTASSTTSLKFSDNFFWSTSCWYCPIPIALGSILTNSANGSCKRLAIEIAPLNETFKSGYSSVASFDAE